MTKEQYIELIKGRLTSANANPDLTEKYHEARIELFINMAFNDIIYQVFVNNLDEKDLYVRTYTVDVNVDENCKQYSIDLPVNILQLPNNSGIHKISPVGENWSFNPITQLSEDVFSELEVNKVCKTPSYYFNTKKVFFQYYDWKNQHIKQVRLDVVLPFEEYADDDQVVIPAGKEAIVFDNVFQMMANQLTADHTNNLNELQV